MTRVGTGITLLAQLDARCIRLGRRVAFGLADVPLPYTRSGLRADQPGLAMGIACISPFTQGA